MFKDAWEKRLMAVVSTGIRVKCDQQWTYVPWSSLSPIMIGTYELYKHCPCQRVFYLPWHTSHSWRASKDQKGSKFHQQPATRWDSDFWTETVKARHRHHFGVRRTELVGGIQIDLLRWCSLLIQRGCRSGFAGLRLLEQVRAGLIPVDTNRNGGGEFWGGPTHHDGSGK